MKHSVQLFISLVMTVVLIGQSTFVPVFATDPPILVNYSFEDNVLDVSGHSNNGTIVQRSGSASYTTGHTGKAIQLSGGAYVSLPNDLILNNNSFTVAMWFKTSNAGGLFGYQNTNVNEQSTEFVPILSVRSDGKLCAEMWTGTSMTVLSSDSVMNNEWHRVVLTSDTSSIRVYLDGVDIGGATGVPYHLQMRYNQIGTNAGWGRASQPPAYTWNDFNGLIDDFVFYSNALSSSEVAKSTQTITFSSIAAKSFGNAPFQLSATASSGLSVTYTSSDTSVATISGSTVTILKAGTTVITASQGGNENYSAAPNVTQTLTVNGASISPSGTSNSYTLLGAAVPVDNSIAVTGTTLSGAKVYIGDGFQLGDKINYASGNGITGSYTSGNGVLTLTGDASVSAYQAAFRSITFSTTSSAIGERKIVFAAQTSKFMLDDHYYEYKSSSGTNWTNASNTASNLSYLGRTGYLATITSAGENSFVAAKCEGDGWLGATDQGHDKQWYWVTGPEGEANNGQGTLFATQKAYTGISGTGVGILSTVSGLYHNFDTNEPNDYYNQNDIGRADGENYLHMRSSNGKWNDYPYNNGSIQGYLVEYGGSSTDNPITDTSIAEKTVEVIAALTVPQAPTNVSAEAGNGQAVVSFDAPSSNGGSSITGYSVTSSPGGITASGISSSITITGLTNGTEYTFIVVATNGIGDSSSSSSNSITPTLFTSAPTNISATVGNGQATVEFTPPSGLGNESVTYIVTASPGGITASGITSPIVVTGLTNGTAYTFTVLVSDGTEISPISSASAEVTPVGTNTAPSTQSLVQMDGVSFKPGTVQTSYVSGVKSATVNATSAITTKVQQLVEAIKTVTDSMGSAITTAQLDLFPDPAREVKIDLTKLRADKVDVKLTADVVAEMGAHDMTLNVVNGEVSHLIPAIDIAVTDITGSMGLLDQPEKVEIKVQIENPGPVIIGQVQDRAELYGGEMVLPPMNFEVKAINLETKEEKTVERFTNYVGRVFEVPEGVDPTKITTGIVLNSDGTFSHVPTAIIESDGKYYARINSLTNSTYSVIWHPFAFTDMETHWAKKVANQFGAKLVVEGDKDGNLHPDEAINRGEFALILSKALGIYRTGEGTGRFADVLVESPYYDAVGIAADYGLVSGYPNGTYGQDSTITREEAMVVLAKAAEIVKLQTDTGIRLVNYKDSTSVASWAKIAVEANLKSGIIVGNNGMLRPKDDITRAEILSTLNRMLVNAGLIN